MRGVFTVVFLFAFKTLLFAQDMDEKVGWDISFNQEEQTIEFKATIDEGWHMYSQHLQEDVGPVPTSFRFNDTGVKIVGKTVEPKPIEAYDPNFEGDVSYFEKEVVFTQRVKSNGGKNVDGVITYMVCNGSMCLPPMDKPFKLRID